MFLALRPVLISLCSLTLSGQPSHCYFYDGDGVCEEFERGYSVQDCGFFTPNGFIDQWASSATASHQDWRCPALSATGEPNLNLVMYNAKHNTLQFCSNCMEAFHSPALHSNEDSGGGRLKSICGF